MLACDTHLAVHSEMYAEYHLGCHPRHWLSATLWAVLVSARSEAIGLCVNAGSKAVQAVHAQGCTLHSRRDSHWPGNIWVLQVRCTGESLKHCFAAFVCACSMNMSCRAQYIIQYAPGLQGPVIHVAR